MIQNWYNAIGEKEIENFATCIHNRQVLEGDMVRQFEKEVSKYLNIPYVVATPSGTAALALALMAAGVGPGDEVLVPDLTFVATANAAHMVGANVVIAPIEKKRMLIDLERIDDFVTDKTKAIIPVDLNGRISASEELRQKYSSRGICIIDDACQAFMSGAEGKKAGTMADMGCFSFGISKTVAMLRGGAVVTRDKDLYEKMNIIKTQGMSSIFDGEEYVYPGFNFKVLDGLAAIGLEQLKKVDTKMSHMKKMNKMYRDGLEDIEGLSFFEERPNEFLWMNDIICEDSDHLRNILVENEIGVRPLYFPLHNAEHFISRDSYVESTEIQRQVLLLPSGPDQAFENVEKVIDVIRKNI
jgi:dTDP-4-amino-4,6-dideoxygalactose transaminase